MITTLRPALVLLALLTLVTGVVYPLSISAIARLGFADKASGSLIVRDGKIVGSALIGQPFDDPKYVWGRLSSTSAFAYDASASSGSNLGPSNPKLTEVAKARLDALKSADPDNTAAIPADLVTASASGLDPHISPAGARYQVARVARARGLDPAKVSAIIDRFTETPQLGVLGDSRVNVLLVNLALDRGE
jgi:K+-transporting ATPase ATPase C chain